MYTFECDYCGKTAKRAGNKDTYKKHFCSNTCRYLARRVKNDIFYEDNYAYILCKNRNLTKKVLFDIEDAEKVEKYNWHLHIRKEDMQTYAIASTYILDNKKRKTLKMHRYLINYNGNLTVDHINHNTLDNRKKNLRVVSIFENNLNKTNNTSGCVGVAWNKNGQSWQVTFQQKYIGSFKNFDEAVKVRKEAEKNYQLQNNV